MHSSITRERRANLGRGGAQNREFHLPKNLFYDYYFSPQNVVSENEKTISMMGTKVTTEVRWHVEEEKYDNAERDCRKNA